ncbi:MAG TPA: purine-nucleoside phosphorylase [Saprospiraceae bacterium]|nr:purine-nucleoside phosphorylase [Saprospiraceae bacterium]
MTTYFDSIQNSAQYIQSKTNHIPKVGLILGSGLGSLANEIQNADIFPYSEIPDFPVSTVKGHAGQLVIGELDGQVVVAMQGRLHYYEGYTMKQITFPVRVFKALGVETLIVTNASGGINPLLYPGALMFIKDHINFMGNNPLIGPNDERLGTRFPDMLHAYDKGLLKLGQNVAKKLDIRTFTGVHSAVTGPTFETAAEIKMLSILGADTIGMSTIPEVIVAAHAQLKVLGVSAITDMAMINPDIPVTHEEVIKVANEIKPRFIKLIRGILKELN